MRQTTESPPTVGWLLWQARSLFIEICHNYNCIWTHVLGRQIHNKADLGALHWYRKTSCCSAYIERYRAKIGGLGSRRFTNTALHWTDRETAELTETYAIENRVHVCDRIDLILNRVELWRPDSDPDTRRSSNSSSSSISTDELGFDIWICSLVTYINDKQLFCLWINDRTYNKLLLLRDTSPLSFSLSSWGLSGVIN